MKNYFDFNLTGNKLFPYFMVIFIIGFAFAILNCITDQTTNPAPAIELWSLGIYIAEVIAIVFLGFYIGKMAITAISYKNENLEFNGNYNEYLKINIVGILLSIITLGVYFCWYNKKLMDYFARNTAHKSTNFKFNGRAIVIFLIITIAIVVGVTVVLATALSAKGQPEVNEIIEMSLLGVTSIIIAPVLYLSYRWDINLSYGNKTITMEKGGYIGGCLFILGQIIMTTITIGLYYPAAMIRIVRYFATRIEVRNNEGVLVSKMGCDAKMGKDYLFIFGQLFLTMITACIYYPWALCKIGKRLTSKTYLEEVAK